MPDIALNNDEIEDACDALWYVELKSGMDDETRLLWERVQPLRTGDYGGDARVELTATEARHVLAALESARSGQGLDPDEMALASRLHVELDR